MVATSTVRAIVTFVVCVAVVGSVVAAPVAAADGDPLSDGDDEPIGVSTDNESVSVDAGDDGVTVGTDGIDVDATDEVDDPTAGSSGTTDPTAVDASRDDEELPVNYSDVPVSMIPADLCRGPPSPDLPDPPVDNPTPLPITNPPGAPLTQCDVFDPYDPPFDPTDLPDDPQYDYGTFGQEVGEDGVAVGARGGASPDGQWPRANTIAYVAVGPDGVQTVQLTRVDDGANDHAVFSDVSHAPGTRNGTADGWVVTFGKSGGANVVCDGEACTFDNDGTPAPSESVPTGGSGDGDDGGAEVPCQPPVGPGDAPEPPVDPTNPPEPLPPVENPTPVPIGVPGAPIGPCDVFDPNDPPFDPTSPPEDPQYRYDVFSQEVGEDGVALGARGGASPDSSWPGADTIAYVEAGPDGVQTVQLSRVDDGSRDHVVFSDLAHQPGTRNGTADGWVVLFGKSGGAVVVCDGEACTFDNDGTPAPSESVPTGGSGDGGSSTSSSQPSAGTSGTSASGSTGSPSPVEAGTTSLSSVTASGATGADRLTVGTFPGAFQDGLPDAASASDALLSLV